MSEQYDGVFLKLYVFRFLTAVGLVYSTMVNQFYLPTLCVVIVLAVYSSVASSCISSAVS
ncbi:hypothetical protein DFS33DRAFT_630739 [Desarmillaria ectypa]|nr:hypothetical protein DFS33DRAFT_630739 [Desarmillaria ectypa]